MANDDSNGFLWVLAIGATVWAWSNHEKLKQERIERIDAVQVAYSDVSKMDLRIADLERELAFTKKTAGIAVEAVDAVSERVSKNAKVANENAIADMTERGVCGRETIYHENGGWSVQNRKCTIKDLK